MHAKLTDLPDWVAATVAHKILDTPNSFGWITPHDLSAGKEGYLYVAHSAAAGESSDHRCVLILRTPDEEGLALYVPHPAYRLIRRNVIDFGDGMQLPVARIMHAAPAFTQPGPDMPVGEPTDFDLHLACQGRHPSGHNYVGCDGRRI